MVGIDAMHFGSMPGKGTVNAIFTVCQLQERYLKKKMLYFAFVDLGKAFDQALREIVKWAMRKLGAGEWLIRAVMVMHWNGNSVFRINRIVGDKFCIKVGVHQGSVLHPLLFITVFEALSRESRSSLSC